jgi:SAM-dependent methyltransferase
LTYYGWMYERLRVKFPASRSIERNYSQAYQDLFVLTMLDGKRDGSFFEIGCGDQAFGSNTKLLEEWGWNGVSIDIKETVTEKFARQRKSKVLTADATKLDYDVLIEQDYDYLQIDIDPALNSLQVLLRIPFERRRFAVITFEHDDYCSPGIKERSRTYLRSHGYVMVVGDIAPDRYNSFEDWWIHPDLVDPKIVAKMLNTEEGPKKADRYMLCDMHSN